MPTRPRPATITGPRVYLRPPRIDDAAAFLTAVRASRALHGRWTHPPHTKARYDAFVARFGADGAASTNAGYLVMRREDHALVGVFNFSEIVRGAFRSTYLGYMGFLPHAGNGYMTEGMALALDVAFRKLDLHRVEVNIQPTNMRSLALAKRIGFTREGYSRRYVKIAGRWRDHERYAMLAEDWTKLRKRHLARRAARVS
jgi:[ribosomal protein S5]-alanine N-acetyltransferase